MSTIHTILALVCSVVARLHGDKATALEMTRSARIFWHGYIRTVRAER